MIHPLEFIETETVILSPHEGGRGTPLSSAAYNGKYRPHIVMQSRQVRQAQIETRDGMRHITDEYLGVAFWKGPNVIPVSAPFTLIMLLMYAPDPAYDRLVPGAEFTIREGPKIIGHGKVLRRTTEENI